MSKLARKTPIGNPLENEGLRLLAKLFAGLVVEELRPLLSADRADEIVDRKTCEYSKRWWDNNVGKTFTTFRDGRRLVAKRADVVLAFEREQKLAPKTAPTTEPTDADEAALVRAGIRLVGGAK